MRLLLTLGLTLTIALAACSSGDSAAPATTRVPAATGTTTPAECATALDAIDRYIGDRSSGHVVAKPLSFGQCRYNAAAPAPCIDAMRAGADVVDAATAESFSSSVLVYRTAAAACRQRL